MTIYIRPDGTISGSNEPLPVRPDPSEKGQLLWYYRWKESCIDFEDQKHAMSLLPDSAFSHTNRRGGLLPDTIIENVDVETEKQWQYQHESGDWVDCEHPSNYEIQNPELEYRTVLRIKDKQ